MISEGQQSSSDDESRYSEGPTPPRTPTLSSGRKLLYTVGIILGLLLVLEVGLRVSFRLWKGTWDFLPQTRFAAELYEPHPYLCYVLRPDVRVTGYGGEVRTNRWGFRGPEVERKKPAGTVRIVCLGGSTTFSLSASDNDHTWPAQLEKLLNQRHAPVRFEVLNFGTPAYCAIDSFLTLALRGLDFDPDIVLIHDGWNDVSAVFRPDAVSDFVHHRGLYTRLPGRLLCKSAIGRLCLLAAPRFGWRSNETIVEYSDQGAALFQRYVESTILLAQPRGIEPVLVTIADRLPANPADWKERNPLIVALRRLCGTERELARRREAAFIDLSATFPKDPAYFSDDAHKTDAGLEVVARMIADGLDGEKVLSRVLTRRKLVPRQP